MNIKRPFAPAFLNKLDNFLLLDKPLIWSARTHLAVYYSILFMVALAAVYFVVPDDPRSFSTVHVWAGFLCIVCIIAIVAWLIYLLRFNVFKRFGVRKPVTSLVEFLLYFIATSVIASFCLIPPAIETAKANYQYSSDELVSDMNNINIKICQLEYDSLPKKWQADTVRVHDTLPKSRDYVSADVAYDDAVTLETTATDYAPPVPRYRLIDTASLARMLIAGDSLVRVNDSTYLLYNCPDYIFLAHFHVNQSPTNKHLTSVDLYRRVINGYTPPDKVKVRSELNKIINKYYYEGNKRYYDETGYRKPFRERLKDRYKLRTVEQSIDNITTRKYRWADHGDTFWLTWFYCSFSLTLLIFAFRHTTARVFFLSILSIVILFILTVLSMAFLPRREFAFHIWLIVYFVVFAAISATTLTDEKRKVVKGIAINLFAVLLPFLPLIATSLYYRWLQYRYGSLITQNLLINYRNMRLHYDIAQIAGPLLFLVLLVIYIHKLYRKWWGLPVE